MTTSIWKYELTPNCTTLDMPHDAQILSVQIQRGYPKLWALVDTNAPEKTRHFRIYGTGDEIDDSENLKYIGTFQMHGALVWHLFEKCPIRTGEPH